MSSSDSDDSFENKNDVQNEAILPEDAYVKKMEEIIERRFYPDNKKMRSTLMGEDEESKNTEINITPSLDQIHKLNSSQDKEAEQLTLDEFLTIYSGEDNFSFEKLSQKEMKKKIEEYSHFYKDEGVKFLEASSTQNSNVPHIMSHNAWKYTVKNALMYNPTGVDFNEKELEQREKGRPTIDPTATRMIREVDPFTKQKMERIKREKLQQLHKQGKLDIDGNLPTKVSNQMSEIDSFVDYAEPEAAVPASPLMTWGHVGSTPCRLTPSHKSVREFSIAPPSEREEMAYNLGRVISKNNASSVFKTPTNLRSSRRTGKMLSPAARRLMESHKRTKNLSTPLISAMTPRMKKK